MGKLTSVRLVEPVFMCVFVRQKVPLDVVGVLLTRVFLHSIVSVYPVLAGPYSTSSSHMFEDACEIVWRRVGARKLT